MRPGRSCSLTRRDTTSSSGVAGNIRDGAFDEFRLWLVRDGCRAVGAALQRPPYNVVLARPQSTAALAALVEALATEEIPGVVGTVPEVEQFAKAWSQRTGVPARTNTLQGVYSLEQVIPPADVPGTARVAAADDRELALRWWIASPRKCCTQEGPAVTAPRRRSTTGCHPRPRRSSSGRRTARRFPRRLGRADAERHPRRARLSAAGAARPRLRNRADGGTLAAPARRPPRRRPPPLLLPLHRPREPEPPDPPQRQRPEAKPPQGGA